MLREGRYLGGGEAGTVNGGQTGGRNSSSTDHHFWKQQSVKQAAMQQLSFVPAEGM